MKMIREMKGQSATEFLSTYAWAFLLMVIIIAAIYYIVYVPTNAVPVRCSFDYGIECVGVSVGTGLHTVVNLYLLNGQEYDLVGNTIATVNVTPYGTSNAICTPANVLQGGVIICSITLPSNIPVSKNIVGTMFLNSSVCLNGPVTNCSSPQPISYLGNFTTSVSSKTAVIPVTISLTESQITMPSSTYGTIILTAHVNILNKPARGASVFFNIASDTAAGTTNTLSPSYALSDTNGNATTTLIVTSGSGAGSITVDAVFAGMTATNTIAIT